MLTAKEIVVFLVPSRKPPALSDEEGGEAFALKIV